MDEARARAGGGASRQSLILQCKPFDVIRLFREPENPHGSTAIRVTTADGVKLGYLPSKTADELSWEIDRSHREWLAVVRKVFRNEVEQHSALLLCLLRVKVIDNSDAAVFEREFRRRFGARCDLRFHAQMDRAFGLNEDGSDRQQLIVGCHRYEELSLHREPQNERDSNSIWVGDAATRKLGYLEQRIAAEIAHQMDAGRNWAAVVHHCEPTPGGKRVKLHLCVYRSAVA